jgi:glycosidase
MRKILLVLSIIILSKTGVAQLLSWSPQFPTENSTLVITVDCSKGNQGLLNAADPNNIYVHTGVTTNLSNNGGQQWLYVNGTIGGAWGSATAGLKAVSLGNNKYQYTINNIRTFYGVPAGETIKNVSILFRDVNANGSLVKKQANSDGSDMYIPVYPAGTNAIKIVRPFLEPRFVPFVEPITAGIGQSISVKALSSAPVGAALSLTFNGTQIATTTLTDSVVGTANITAPGTQEIVAKLTVGANNFYDTIKFFVAPVTIKKPLPPGVKEGINYYNYTDSVTLVLYAPKKSNCMLMGDFPGSNWTFQSPYQMFQTADSNYFWITVKNLTPGTEYAFNYVVDNTIYVADPHCEKILDPFNDPFIPATTYPSLKPYPTNANVSASKNGYVSVLQICGPQYTWRANTFTPPNEKNLIIYELLPRDFNVAQNFQTIIDSIGYFKKLGINAIEFMPLQEFSGNQSWGYNPIFYFAPDKAYGTKNKLKELIDTLHSNGIAAILDVVYNQLDAFNTPQGKMYWDAVNGRPAANNPWLNPIAKHPFNVFEDFNHESTATQYLVNTSLEHWIKEYRIDGFRFDLSKGFTQKFTSDVGAWGAYDQSRVDNLNRYYDYIKPLYPNTYMILEHLGIPQEENVLITKGFMPWRKMTDEYNESTMGQTGNKNIGDIMWNYTNNGRNAPAPRLIGYMESHDEQRLMYKNVTFGINSGGYNVRDTNIALRQMEAAGAIFYTIPGPKMLWQFGERGYDQSINRCADGSIGTGDACRLDNKPPLWGYMQNPNRRKLYDAWSKMIKLRLSNPNVFNNNATNFEPNSNDGYVKVLQIGDATIGNMQITIVANFAPAAQTKTVTFQKTGDWYNYISSDNNATTGSSTVGLNGLTNSTFNLTDANQTIRLAAGEYHIYVSGTPCTTPAPTATNTTVTYCQNAAANPLTATGNNLLWYTTATGGTGSSTAPTPSTTTVGSTIYYVSQTIGCEGPRLAITVTIVASTPAPTVVSPVVYCQNATATQLSATGTALLWYTVATGGAGSATAPIPSTTTVGNTTYYVSQTLSCGEGPRAAIVVTVNAIPSAPTVTSPIAYCQNATAIALSATGSNLLWYTTASGGTGTATAPVPSTAILGSVSYYVSQTTNNCEGPRAAITVTVSAVPTAPVVVTPVTYCQNTVATPLTATGTNLLWYTAATGGTGSVTAPTPSTTTVGSTTYYVSQTVVCEGPRAAIVVDIVATTPAPTVVTPVNYCQNSTPSALTATGTNLLWYTAATGGTGSATAPTPSTSTIGSVTYYVSQTLSCGEGPRAAIVVNVNGIPAAPTVNSPVAYCQNSTATALTATGTNLLWYTAATGGTGGSTAPTPSTTNAGSTSYYVSQTVNSCESPRATIVVNIAALPLAPTATTASLNYCQNIVAPALSATGTNLLWYTVATGGTGTATAPVPSTTTAGTTNYYVSQSANGCEGPRTTIAVTVTALAQAPATTTAFTYCQNATATVLTATGTNLLWYTVATGGTGSSTAPTPLTSSAGVTNYYVSQTSSCGESSRSAIAITVTATPAIPTGLNTTAININSAILNWTAVNNQSYYVFYKLASATTWIPVVNGTATSSFALNNLQGGQQYDWRVSTNCDNSNSGNYATAQFTTSSRNNAVVSVRDGIGIKLSPNPFATQGILDYIVPGSGTVTISLFNSLGQRLNNIYNSNQAAGQYELNVSRELGYLNAGMYIIRVQQNGNANYIKFIKK